MPELATLRINLDRSAWWSSALATMVIEMDGRELARLRNSQGWAGQVEPGRHFLSVRQQGMTGKPMELVLAPGGDVSLALRTSSWTGLSTLTEIEGTTNSPGQPQVLGVTETHRSAEPIGTDTVRTDNRSGVGRVTRTVRVTREWSRMVSLDSHAIQRISGGAQIGPNWLALKAGIEQSLEHTYGISVGRREEYAEEIGVEIEPGADVTVVLTWKRIWQHGFAHVLVQGCWANVPFRMAVGTTFDPVIR